MSLLTDLRYGLRLLLRNPGFAAIAILALALGIGANTAIFSAVDAILLQPLPYAQPDRLAVVWEDASHIGFPRNTPAPANYVDWRQQNRVFTDLAALRYRTANLTREGPPEQVFGRGVTPNLFGVLGVNPLLGRVFTEDEDRKEAKVVLLSYILWQRRFGGDRSVVGREIPLNGESFTVIGVMPRGFSFPEKETDFWVPFGGTPEDWHRRSNHFLNVVGRMKPGVTLEQAQSEMSTIARRLQQEYPNTNTNVGAVVVPLKEQIVGRTQTGLVVLLVAAGCVLLIACANIANLLLARAAGRQREMAVRTALGAERRRLITQMLTESLLLAFAGGAVGLVIAQISRGVLEKLIPDALSASAAVAINGRALLFAFGVSVLSGVIFGLAPAWQAPQLALSEALKQGGRSGIGTRHQLFRKGLVVAEVALSLVLLIGAGLMLQTLSNLRAIELGFQPKNLLTLRTVLPQQVYGADDARRRSFYSRVLDQVRTLPGVVTAGFASNLPFTSRGNTNGYTIENAPEPKAGDAQDALYREVSSGYLQTIGAHLKTGRLFSESDAEKTQRVVIVNETMVRRHFPDADPIGKRLSLGRPSATNPWLTIVGVVADVRERGLEQLDKPAVYLPLNQVARPEAFFLAVRVKNDPMAFVNAVRQIVWAVDPEQPVSTIRTMEDWLDLDVADRQQQMTVLGAFALLALVLAVLGIYGVLSYTVTQRTREIGLRMALGASRSAVLGMVVGQGFTLVLTGLGAGLLLSLAATRLMGSMLYGVTPADPLTYAAVAGFLSLAALLGCYVPARRAALVDPMVALRDE